MIISGRVCLGSEADLYTRLSGCPLMPQKQTELLCEPTNFIDKDWRVEPVLQPRRPTPALRLSNPLATLRGSRPCAGAAMVWTSPAASEALALTRVSRPCLCSARLSP